MTLFLAVIGSLDCDPARVPAEKQQNQPTIGFWRHCPSRQAGSQLGQITKDLLLSGVRVYEDSQSASTLARTSPACST